MKTNSFARGVRRVRILLGFAVVVAVALFEFWVVQSLVMPCAWLTTAHTGSLRAPSVELADMIVACPAIR